MKQLLTNLKALFFYYTSITVLLLLAVIQSDQRTYDLALEQLDKIEHRSSSYRSDELKVLINESADLQSKYNKLTKYADSVGVTIEFQYQTKSADYSSINDHLQFQPPSGFDFGIANRVIDHKRFTEVKPLQSQFVPVSRPRSLDQYEALHNGALSSILIPVFKPVFKRVRLEAYRYKTTNYNSIEKINTTRYEAVEIVDQVDLVDPSEPTTDRSVQTKRCTMSPVVTAINGQYAYMCEISNISIGSVEYSGARVIVPSQSSTERVSNDDLLNLFDVPLDDKRKFTRAFLELNYIAGPYSDLSFSDVEKIIRAEKERNPSTVNVFGTEISIPLLTEVIVPILVLICLYMTLHLNEVVQRAKSRVEDDVNDVPWIAVYRGAANEYVLLGQLILLPLLLVVAISIRPGQDSAPVFSWIMFIFLVAVNLLNFYKLRQFRFLMKANPKGT